MAFAIDYRPQNWDEVLGQDAIIASLRKTLAKKNHPRVYMLHGPYGSGKTTIGRLIAKELGCADINILEHNIGDNTQVDYAREIARSSRYMPLVYEGKSKIKVYILDEFHRATVNAQEALLKHLEEPPSHAYFILCTTEPKKVISTIQSRCVKYEVKTLDATTMLELLENVLEKEKLEIDDKVLTKIIKVAEGHPRDALQLLEQVVGIDDVDTALEIVARGLEDVEVIEICRILFKNRKWKNVASLLSRLTTEPEKARITILSYFTSIMINPKSTNSTVEMAARIASCFENSFYNAGKQGLILACYAACMEEETVTE